MPPGFPIFLNLDAVPCIVIGSGREADSKAAALYECGAKVTRLGNYSPGCLAGFYLAVAAGPDRSHHQEIFDEGERLGVLVNCVDDPARCRFIFPGIVRRGDLGVAISTNGACPALAVRLKERLDKELGPEYAEFLELVRPLREPLAAAVPDFDERRRRWYALVDSEIFDLLRSGDRAASEALLRKILLPEELP